MIPSPVLARAKELASVALSLAFVLGTLLACFEGSTPVILHNGTGRAVTVSVAFLADGVEVDSSVLQSQRRLPLRSSLFRTVAAPTVLRAGDSADLQLGSGQPLLLEADSEGEHGRWVVIGGDDPIDIVEANGRLAVDARFVRDMSADTPACKTAPMAAHYSVELPNLEGRSALTVERVAAPIDGCFSVFFREVTSPEHVCLPQADWPFMPGDEIGLDGTDLVSQNASTKTRLTQTDVVETVVDSSCTILDSCGTIGLDVVARLPNGTSLRQGEAATSVAGNTETRWLIARVESLVVVNTGCKGELGKTLGTKASLIRIERTQIGVPDGGMDDAATD